MRRRLGEACRGDAVVDLAIDACLGDHALGIAHFRIALLELLPGLVGIGHREVGAELDVVIAACAGVRRDPLRHCGSGDPGCDGLARAGGGLLDYLARDIADCPLSRGEAGIGQRDIAVVDRAFAGGDRCKFFGESEVGLRLVGQRIEFAHFLRGEHVDTGVVGEGEHGRLAGIGLRLHAQQAGNATGIGFGANLSGPLGHAVADFAGGHVLGRHDARGAPIALQGIGIGEVLANLGRVLSGAQRIAEHMDAPIGTAG